MSSPADPDKDAIHEALRLTKRRIAREAAEVRYRATTNDQRRRTVQDRYRIGFVVLCLLLLFASLVAPEGIPEWMALAPVVIATSSLLGLTWIIRSRGRRDR